jgi:type II secretory pathway pseudopilin PulG
MISTLKRLSSRGDTIPEVLIALSILGAIITSAYALTNRNQSTNQVSYERSQAVKIADTQLEMLRAYTDQQQLPSDNYFCLTEVDDPLNPGQKKIEAVPTPNPGAPNPSYPPQCTQGADGSVAALEGRYSYAIWSPAQAQSIGGNGASYAVTVRWEGIQTQNEEVKIFYSLYSTNNPAYSDPTTGVVAAPQCSDGRDNDDPEDSLADRLDPACHTDGNPANLASYNRLIASEVNPLCNNGRDDDGDGRSDAADGGCHTDGNPANAASYVRTDNDETNAICSDGLDNDGDGTTDYPADRSCSGFADNDEANPRQCEDGFDNDGDGRVDHPADASCSSRSDNDELNPTPPPRQALYGCYFFNNWTFGNLHRTNHRYTTNPADCNGAEIGPYLEGYVPLGSNPGAVPMYGGFNGWWWDDFYTKEYSWYVGAHNAGWWDNSGVRFYVYNDCSVPGTVAFHRWWSAGVGNHVYSTSPPWAFNPNGFNPSDGGGTYAYEGTEGCIFSGLYP